MNETRFKMKLLEMNCTVKDIADALEISSQAVYKKLNGETRITVDDVRRIKAKLNLTDDEVSEIFLL